jgi:hypothetical protein
VVVLVAIHFLDLMVEQAVQVVAAVVQEQEALEHQDKETLVVMAEVQEQQAVAVAVVLEQLALMVAHKMVEQVEQVLRLA